MGGPAFRGVRRIDGMLMTNALEFELHPIVHVCDDLEDGTWIIFNGLTGEFKRNVFDTSEGVGVRALAI